MNKPKSMSRKAVTAAVGALMAMGLLFIPGKSVFADGDVKISTAFPDANFADYVADNIDNNHDGVLTQAECSLVEVIDVHNMDIEDLTGLKYFTNLEVLECYNNPSLGSLDVSANIFLTKLLCFNTSISELELTYNNMLEYLDCTNPNLEYLNITGCNKLINNIRDYPGVYNDGNPNDWGCYWYYSNSDNNKCTAINVGITLEPCIVCEIVFPDDNFREQIKDLVDKDNNIVLDDNEITIDSLDEADKGIIDLAGIEYLTELKWLSCHDNSLTSLDLSQLTKLEGLDAYSNQLVNVDLSKNPKLSYLDLSGMSTLKNIDISNCEALQTLMSSTEKTAKSWVGVSGYSYGDNMTNLYFEYPQAADINAIAINRLHFPDANFRSYITLNIDNNSDGYLSAAEIGKVGILSISNKGISNLKGIEFFTELYDLNCSNNKLTSLDLSANPKIDGVDCDDNFIMSINLGKNTNSLSLNCANNRLKELDLSELTGLDFLWCSGNKDLTSLDLSKNTELAWLTCYDTGLSSLDVSKNTKLKKIDVHGTKMSEIDTTMCPDLHYLDVSRSSFKTVNIYSNPKVLLGYKEGTKTDKKEGGKEFVEYRYDKSGTLGVLCVDKDTVIVDVKPTATPTPTATAAPTAKPTAAPTAKPAEVTVSLDKTTASIKCGDKLTLKATVANTTDAVTWESSDTKVATVDATGKITTKMAGQANITAKIAGKYASCLVTVLYKDVTNTKDFWFEPTNYLTAANVVKGYDKQTKFKPANDCTRAQMVTFLWRLAGEPAPKSTKTNFKDIKSKDYFYKPVLWAVEKGITTGVSKTKFNPQGVCTRAQTVTFLWRMAQKPEPKTTKNPFKDVKKKDYFYKATLWASEKKILAGYSDKTFRPQGKCLRRQMVTFLYKYDKFVNGKG